MCFFLCTHIAKLRIANFAVCWVSSDNQIKQRVAWLLLGWHAACPVIDGGLAVTSKPLVTITTYVRETSKFLTGHGYIRKYLYRMGKLRSPRCAYWPEEDDDVHHTFFACGRFSWRCFGRHHCGADAAE
ncbi:hypothetical protein J6590_064782 [Homalodisca vitripennis]|nr:hypothetical protein J6590_064782 [Homalodisca vitripennis]